MVTAFLCKGFWKTLCYHGYCYSTPGLEGTVTMVTAILHQGFRELLPWLLLFYTRASGNCYHGYCYSTQGFLGNLQLFQSTVSGPQGLYSASFGQKVKCTEIERKCL